MSGVFAQLRDKRSQPGDPLRNRNRYPKFLNCALFIAEHSRERIAMFTAGFNNLSSQPLSDLNRFSSAAPFRYQAGDVNAGSNVTAILKRFHTNANGHFFNLGQMFLFLHRASLQSGRRVQL